MSTAAIEPKKQGLVLAEAIERIKPQIKMALPRGMDADQFVRTVMNLIQKTPKLATCTPNSILLSVSQAAELGLQFGTTLGHAYLVPYWDDKAKGNVAQLQIGWRGFIELARRSGLVRGILAEVVYEHDTFLLEKGLEPKLVHKPKMDGERGEAIGAYAVATFKDGYKDFEWMELRQIEHCRASSRAKSADSPWNTHWEEMARKTPIRRLCKRLPLSPEDAVLIRAAVLDEYNEAGIDFESGVLELEDDSPMAAPKAKIPQYQVPQQSAAETEGGATQLDYLVVTAPSTERKHGMPPVAPAGSFAVHYYVGNLLTFVSGNVRALESDFKSLNGEPSKEKERKGQWTIPAGRTDDLVKLCDEKSLPCVEVDDKGTPFKSDLFEGS